jgi:L-lysine 2,3-aminomutase
LGTFGGVILPFKDPAKRKAYHRAYSKKHYAENKEHYIEKSRKHKQATRDWIRSLKEGRICSQCGEDDPIVLDFHHPNPNEKGGTVANIAHRWSRKRILQEIEKCDVMCANCHRRHHFHGD